ncbi:helicase-associated domain-containing protein [Rhodococcus sp. Q]|uniref:helicase-associated domain-containing protein n=1 Tax=Rhodococcus sp. Q TaxID=2502252 RepID=UPI0010F77047|nr:helicase-associated domain-containing protein [Rhodococcus sp. Q]
MTDIDPAATPEQLATWLGERSDAELAELLRLRPDLAVPPPANLSVLASRAEQRASVLRVADNLSVLELTLVGLLAREGAIDTGVSRERLGELVAGRAPARSVDRALTVLRDRALVWGSGLLRVTPAAREAVGWRVDPATTTLTAEQITEALAALTPDERRLLETLATSSPIGRTRDAAPDTSPDRPVQRLLASGLLVWLDAQTVELPHQVGQVLRGETVTDPDTLTPPAVRGRKRTASEVNAAAAGEALEMIRHCEEVLAALGEHPAPTLKAGGLGVRESRRLAKSVGVDDGRIGLILELLAGAGLIASGAPDPLPASDTGDDYWAPTLAADAWLDGNTAHRWQALAQSWLDLPRRPWTVGLRDPNDKPIAALSEEVRASGAPRDRRFVLELVAELGTGVAATPDEVAAMVAWRRPRWSMRLGVSAIGHTLAEATAVGLVGRGAVASPGRSLLHDGPPESVLADMTAALPKPIDYVLVQADLTVVAPGPLVPELLAQVHQVADVESAGAATVYRVGESSVRRALDAGRTASELHALFATHSKTPVPQALTYLIDDVARRHGRLRAGVARSFVRCDDPATLAEVLASPVAEELALRALAPTVAVSQAELGDVLERLRRVGFAPAGEDSSGAIVDLRRPGARVAKRRERPTRREPAPPTPEQYEQLVRQLRAGERAAATTQRGAGVRSDGSRAGSAATMALLQLAVKVKRSVRIGYVDAQGVASVRIVDPVSVGGGQLDAFDPADGAIRRFTLHRVTSVALVE